jgi:uncharacterized RDD family membrane protein YckC
VPKQDSDNSEMTPKYVWDPDKMSWVEAKPASAKRPEIVPTMEEEAGPAPAEEIPDEDTVAEGFAVEAAPEIEEMERKGVWIRAGGALVDIILISIVDIIIHYTVGRVVDLPAYIVLLYGIIYYLAFWSWRGQTPGLMLIGAKIVRVNGTRLDVGRAILRYLFYLVPFYAPLPFLGGNYANALLSLILPIIGLAIMALNRDKKGLHDYIAGTLVVNSRTAAPLTQDSEYAEPEQPDEDGTGTSEQS